MLRTGARRIAREHRFLDWRIRRRLDPASHPAPELLVCYYSGDVSAAQSEEIRLHLAGCRQCPELLLDLDRFLKPEEEGERMGEVTLDTAWRDFQARLKRARLKALGSRVVRFFTSRSLESGLAAALLAATVSLSFWNASLRGELEQPQANVPIESLQAPRAIRGLQGPFQIRLPAEAERFVLTLNPAEIPLYPEYQAEILDSRGCPLTLISGLKKSDSDNFRLGLSRHLLPAGTYSIRLLGVRNQRSSEIEAFPFRILDL